MGSQGYKGGYPSIGGREAREGREVTGGSGKVILSAAKNLSSEDPSASPQDDNNSPAH